MIKVFRSPIGKRELKRLQDHIRESGWLILSIRRSEDEMFWNIRCANKEWFLELPYEKQKQVSLGRPADA